MVEETISMEIVASGSDDGMVLCQDLVQNKMRGFAS